MSDSGSSKQKPTKPKVPESLDEELKVLLEQMELKSEALKKIFDFFGKGQPCKTKDNNDE